MEAENELIPNREFWRGLWQEGDTGWDIGYPSPALVGLIDELEDKSMRILIPGAGNAWEAEYLHQQGFTNVDVLDYSDEAISSFAERVPGFPQEHLMCADFFAHDRPYDFILEQTFFCALHPSKREAYVDHMHRLLVPGGQLAGLLFNDPLNPDKPPYGGNAELYTALFTPRFEVLAMEPSANSIPPRQGRELLFRLKRV